MDREFYKLLTGEYPEETEKRKKEREDELKKFYQSLDENTRRGIAFNLWPKMLKQFKKYQGRVWLNDENFLEEYVEAEDFEEAEKILKEKYKDCKRVEIIYPRDKIAQDYVGKKVVVTEKWRCGKFVMKVGDILEIKDYGCGGIDYYLVFVNQRLKFFEFTSSLSVIRNNTKLIENEKKS